MEVKWESHLLFSKAIGSRKVFRIILPERIHQGRIPLLFLLHGVDGSEIDWIDKGNLLTDYKELLKAGKIGPMAIVMPSDGLVERGTGYLNWSTGTRYRFEEYLIEELIEHVEQNWPVGGERRNRSIGGLSMGGFASIRIGLTFPHLFQSCSSMSGFFQAHELENLVGTSVFRQMFNGSLHMIKKHSPLTMELGEPGVTPKLLIDCGTEDPYISDNRKMQKKMEMSRVPLHYVEETGAHDWEYWRKRIKNHLEFHDQSMSQP